MKQQRYKGFAFYFCLCCFPGLCVFGCGCGLVSIFGDPTSHEKRVPAEYRFGGAKQPRILVLVNEPVWLGSEVNLRYYVTKRIVGRMVKYARVRRDNLIGYGELSEFHSGRSDFSRLSLVEVGRALQADYVLYVTVADYALTRMSESNYYQGHLVADSFVREVGSDEKVWPESEQSRIVRVSFEVESGGQSAAVERLADAAAHCIVRCFYDCREDSFHIADEIRDSSVMEWK